MASTDEVSRTRKTLERCPPGHEDRGVALQRLAWALYDRFHNEHKVEDLDETITFYRAALELWPVENDNRSLSLSSLAVCLSIRYNKLRAVDDLDEAIKLKREVLLFRPPGHPGRGASLHSLAWDLWKRFQQKAAMDDLEEAIRLHREVWNYVLLSILIGLHSFINLLAVFSDLEEAITLRRVALGLCPLGNSDRGAILYGLACDLWKRLQPASAVRPTSGAALACSLSELSQHLWDRFQIDDAICLATYALELRLSCEGISIGAWVQRLSQGANPDELTMPDWAADELFQTQHATVDLDDAITLYRHILQFRPTGHPKRASSLRDLSRCLADRFRQQHTPSDLEDAITLEQEALQLLMRGDPDYDVSVRDVTIDILNTMPTRLLCNRDAQMSHFVNSQQYSQLLSSCVTCDPDHCMELIHTTVSTYFQYVMFSHRWGEGDPSSRDIEGHMIYGMPTNWGFEELQAFCYETCKRGYWWAWSDTCCIDKGSSAELQEAIGSMFAWYRRSALTIVYLSDVANTGSLGSSEWFRRGWTLQELLAPRTVLFYTQTWVLYKNITSSNHKGEGAVLEELETATGIDSQFLTDFSPGMNDARSRLQWASLRRTTRPEDIAYSLFGIFKIHLPILYGETAENALGRLLAEIISQSGDISVLDWVGDASSYHSCFPVRISPYQPLPPLLPTQPNAEIQASMPVLRTLYCTLAKSPLPRFATRRLALPCIAHRVTTIQLKEASSYASSYAYEIQASGLRSLEITLPRQLESAAMSQGALQLVRPWHLKLLDPIAKVYAKAEEQLLHALGKPFHALLLIELPHNEYKRIASSALITAQPIDSTSILESDVRIFEIV
ncbi:hypothetical protein EDC04DRAFT_3088299 [Pisolithus marmoratus]|nr:hypothetical protein EDC04DRAFT_3088299 [Pisolithus marmoratus]